jgi:hypothetical protein
MRGRWNARLAFLGANHAQGSAQVQQEQGANGNPEHAV